MCRRSIFAACLLRAVAVLVLVASGAAQFKVTPGERDAQNAEYLRKVGSYCRLDFDGGRLFSERWARVQPLTTWRENPDFPGFSVVARYQILPQVKTERGRRPVVFVQYEVSGRYDLREGYLPDPGHVIAQFEIDDSGYAVKINDIDPQRPFVGHARFLEWIEAKLDNEKDPAIKAMLEASIRRFQEQTKPRVEPSSLRK